MAERARRRQRYFSLALLILLVGLWIATWLWEKKYNVDQAILKVQSFFVSIQTEPEMVIVPGGVFRRGDLYGTGGSNEQPVQEVTLKPFALGKYEVTFAEYDRFALATGRTLPSDMDWGRRSRPVINVSWEDAQAYAQWLSEATGKRYRLPTESEWEYAARSGGKDEIWAGTSDERQLKDYAVYRKANRTEEVGSKKPNGLGLYDMSGNVWEWVKDCVHDDYRGAPRDGSAWLEANDGNCDRRVVRGGSWSYGPWDLRVSNRGKGDRHLVNIDAGFRLAQDIP
ncbi:Formylglycine-generating enzyme family protein [Nitrospira tepida]|uniref:Formylglycine-generating enzyme family protein n=1 Tax=Nitrospira tepida TaxID=2973512 RepID=A0AA86N1D8_9BACT|nr:Formylglycine-generating enzyme family protein [Nitrospira tepida]